MADEPDGRPAEDRFGDLRPPPAPDGPSAAERLEREDRLRPESGEAPRRPEVHRPGSRYAWVVAIVMLMGVGVLLITTAVPNTGAGLKGPAPGKVMPDFAAPLATGDVSCRAEDNDCKANLCQRASQCNEASGEIPACALVGDSIFNVCEARQRPLVLTFLSAGESCEPQVDRVERMRRRFPTVNFAAVVGGEDREAIEEVQRRRGWTLPVGVDQDGQVFNLYGIGVCPSTVFAYAGGRVRKTRLGNLTEEQLRLEVRALARSG